MAAAGGKGGGEGQPERRAPRKEAASTAANFPAAPNQGGFAGINPGAVLRA